MDVDAGLRGNPDEIARQPDFEVIRRRAGRVRRRRRNAASSVVAGLTAVVVAAVGLSTGSGDDVRPTAGPTPTPTPTPGVDLDAGWPRLAGVVAARADDLYALYERCRTCAPQLHMSADAGRTWSRRTAAPARGRDVAADGPVGSLHAVAPGVLLWREVGPGGGEEAEPSGSARGWITLDGGRSWQRPGVDEQPVAAVPAGTRVVDCAAVRQETPCRLYAVDPATGRFAPLAHQPIGIRYTRGWLDHRNDAPVGGRLWVPGLDPATRRPAVAASPDGGRTWTKHVFSDGVPADDTAGFVAAMYLPMVAAGADGTAYALTYREDLKHVPYRTTDGGATWERVPGGPIAAVADPGFVTADGAHVVRNGTDFRALLPDGDGYRPVTLNGYPAEPRRPTRVTSQQAIGRYVVTSGTSLSVSDDGWTWHRVDMP